MRGIPTIQSDPSTAPVTDVMPPNTAVTTRLSDSEGAKVEPGLDEKLIRRPPYRKPASEAIAPEIAPLFGEHLRTTSRYGARKPDPAVFERVLEHYRADAADTFFVDDLPENVAAAASLGITTYRYGTAEGLLAAIEAFAEQSAAA